MSSSALRTLLEPQNPLFISQTIHQPLSLFSIFIRTFSSSRSSQPEKPRKSLHLVFKEAVGLSPKPETEDDPHQNTLREPEKELKTLKSDPNGAQIKPRRETTQSKSKGDGVISLYAAFVNKKVDGEREKKMRREKTEVAKALPPEMEVVATHLFKEGYFAKANFLSVYEDRLDFSCFDNAYGRGFIKCAVEKFANDNQEIANFPGGCQGVT